MNLVAGVDSSTQSVKVVIRDAETGALMRSGRAPHPPGTEVHPQKWWAALQIALADAGGIDDVSALSVGGQQHGMVCLDADGQVVREALLWNDTRSATAASDLVAELSAEAWAEAVGSVPVASFTVAKLRWLAEHEPANAARTAAVCLPHDWLTWQFAGAPGLDGLVTDRSDASGTGYWSPRVGAYRMDMLERGLGKTVVVPRVLGPHDQAGTRDGILLGPGAGDNAAAALGLDTRPGDVVISLGTSGTVFGVSEVPPADPTGTVAGFADATGRYLPLVCTLNAAQTLDAAATLLGVTHHQLADLALHVPPGAGGLVLVPYLAGERTPNLPDATGSLHGLTLDTMTPAHLARAAIEGMLCGLADGLDALRTQGLEVERVLLIGGAAANPAVRAIAPTVFGTPVITPVHSEYVADGAARQAAWALAGHRPQWSLGATETHQADAVPAIRSRYAEAREHILQRG